MVIDSVTAQLAGRLFRTVHEALATAEELSRMADDDALGPASELPQQSGRGTARPQHDARIDASRPSYRDMPRCRGVRMRLPEPADPERARRAWGAMRIAKGADAAAKVDLAWRALEAMYPVGWSVTAHADPSGWRVCLVSPNGVLMESRGRTHREAVVALALRLGRALFERSTLDE